MLQANASLVIVSFNEVILNFLIKKPLGYGRVEMDLKSTRVVYRGDFLE